MRCPSLSELPAPPAGKTGWPWTEETPPLPELLPNGSQWPRISIVTPNYGYGDFIEETIRSVLLQGYPNLEYIIIDGGSTDRSVEIIEKYAPWLTYFHSAPDNGQASAILEGLKHVTGEWGNWLNSDDILRAGALAEVGKAASDVPNTIMAIAFGCYLVGPANDQIIEWHPRPPASVYNFFGIGRGSLVLAQPSTFVRTRELRPDPSLHFVMDWALYLSLADRFDRPFAAVDRPISKFRVHDIAKSTSQRDKFLLEKVDFVRRSEFHRPLARIASWWWLIKAPAIAHLGNADANRIWCWDAVLEYPVLLLTRIYWGSVRRRVAKKFIQKHVR